MLLLLLLLLLLLHSAPLTVVFYPVPAERCFPMTHLYIAISTVTVQFNADCVAFF
jgi:hypothetical protein